MLNSFFLLGSSENALLLKVNLEFSNLLDEKPFVSREFSLPVRLDKFPPEALSMAPLILAVDDWL